MKQNISPLSGTPRPKREPLPRTWFLSRGYKKADPIHTNGRVIWLHPVTNDVLSPYGQRLVLPLVPDKKFRTKTTRYLKLTGGYGDMLLARLKYLTFIGDIPKGYTIDHIDGNPLNNDIRNLRAVPREINDRDGGFLRKLRNKKINVAMYPGIILEGFERMAIFKASHSERRYKKLTRTELLQIFLGEHNTIDPRSRFTIDPRSADEIMLYEMQHPYLFDN